MIDDLLAREIAQIHATPPKLVFEFAGAGSLALAWLHTVAGSSRTILEATDRYAPASMTELVGETPEKFVSQTTAEAMATSAYHRAQRLSDGSVPVLGVGLTATIATDRVKRGDHGCWISVCDQAGLHSYGLILIKGARDRAGEEAIVSTIAVFAIAVASGVAEPLRPALLEGEQLDEFVTERLDPIAELLDGSAQSVSVAPSGERHVDVPVHGALLSGSFNPLHQGHERLAQAAAQALDMPALFEIPVINADKPTLSYGELEHRLAQFRWRYPVVLSRAPLFVEKARLFPGCVFVLGYDTAARVIEPRYYGGETERDQALELIRQAGCRFLVAGRVADDGTFLTLEDLAVPTQFADLFLGLSEQQFRVDLSSTAIRTAIAQGEPS